MIPAAPAALASKEAVPLFFGNLQRSLSGGPSCSQQKLLIITPPPRFDFVPFFFSSIFLPHFVSLDHLSNKWLKTQIFVLAFPFERTQLSKMITQLEKQCNTGYDAFMEKECKISFVV